eukprot:488930-Alexandrium_andersonii.AAC.1
MPRQYKPKTRRKPTLRRSNRATHAHHMTRHGPGEERRNALITLKWRTRLRRPRENALSESKQNVRTHEATCTSTP